MPYWLTFIAKPTGHLDTFLVPINERQMALVVATLLIDDAGSYGYGSKSDWRGKQAKRSFRANLISTHRMNASRVRVLTYIVG